MQKYHFYSTSRSLSASRNLQKVQNAVLLSMTTMGNGVGFHLVVCPQEQASLLVSHVLVKIYNSSSAYNPGTRAQRKSPHWGMIPLKVFGRKTVSNSFFEIWLYFQMVL